MLTPLKKTYKFGFEPIALVLFAALLLPNLIWALVPSRYDILRESHLPRLLEVVTYAVQALAVAALVLLVRRAKEPLLPDKAGSLVILTLGYWIFWLIYYFVTFRFEPPLTLTLVICLPMAALPGVALIYCGWCRKNTPAMAAAILFTLLHTLGTLLRFI